MMPLPLCRFAQAIMASRRSPGLERTTVRRRFGRSASVVTVTGSARCRSSRISPACVRLAVAVSAMVTGRGDRESMNSPMRM